MKRITIAALALLAGAAAALACDCGPDYTMLEEHVGDWCPVDGNSQLYRRGKNCPAMERMAIDLGGYTWLNGRCAVVTTWPPIGPDTAKDQAARGLLVDFLCRNKFGISMWIKRKGERLEVKGTADRACKHVAEGCKL